MKSIEDQARAFSKFDSATDIGTDLGSYRQGLFEGFLAGYQAAKELYAAKLKEANDTVAGMVDECEGLKTIIYDHDETNLPTSAKWISVKERLPEDGVGWCTVYGCILSRWSVQPGFYDRESKEWVSRFINGYMDDEGYAPFESVTHWMPLPKAPKEEW